MFRVLVLQVVVDQWMRGYKLREEASLVGIKSEESVILRRARAQWVSCYLVRQAS